MKHKVRLILINLPEGFEAFNKGDYFYVNKKFSEAELNFDIVEFMC